MADASREFVGKPDVARRLLNGAVRATLSMEDPLCVQVLIGSAEALTNEYAAKIHRPLIGDIGRIAKPEFTAGMADFMKSRYNFFKHSNFDHDMEIDTSNLSSTNDLQLLIAIAEYQNVFCSPRTKQMMGFLSFMAVTAPDLFDASIRDRLPEVEEKNDRGRWIATMQMLFKTDPEIVDEIIADKTQLVTVPSGHYVGPPNRDTLKRKRTGIQ